MSNTLTSPTAGGSGRSKAPRTWRRVVLAGTPTDLLEQQEALDVIIERACSAERFPVLGVVSVNLDHVHHFGAAKLDTRRDRKSVIEASLDGQVRWLALLDGAPLVTRANELTGHSWPRLAGSDLIEPLLDRAEAAGQSVGFLGGSHQTQAELAPVLQRRWPRLRVGGYWSPERSELANPATAADLAKAIAATNVDILAVCLGKPRQEQWIAEYGAAAGVKVCLAFGAVVDFLAEHVQRAPHVVADHGLEWAWRLAHEPRRLARRYLIQGPPAYLALQRHSSALPDNPFFVEPATALMAPTQVEEELAKFVGPDELAEVAVLIVTYNNGSDVDRLVTSLRQQGKSQTLRVVVADNGSTDDTLLRLQRHPDLIVVQTGGNLGYAGGINIARQHAGKVRAILVLNPDLEIAPGSVADMLRRMDKGAAVVVPQLLESNGTLYASLRNEPTVIRAAFDAVLGQRLIRPNALSETQRHPMAYRWAHPVDWATGAAMLIDAAVERRLGPWDEQFFLYSEEVDYLRRVRDAGYEVWFEPEARMRHARGGSGSSDQLEALQAVNRVRYQEKLHGHLGAVPYRGVVVLASVMRANQRRHRVALSYLLSRRRWSNLPHAQAAA